MQVIYVAHQLSGDIPANTARALRWLRWLSRGDPDRTYIAPWIANVLSGADDNDPAARAQGLRDDVRVIGRCDGLVLVGGRVSHGMAIERDAMLAAGGEVRDLTHLGMEPP